MSLVARNECLSRVSVFLPKQVFYSGVSKPVFYVASRGHHADIGGITPGSMPPHSTSIHQEGAVFKSFKLVKEGVFQEEGGVMRLLCLKNLFYLLLPSVTISLFFITHINIQRQSLQSIQLFLVCFELKDNLSVIRGYIWLLKLSVSEKCLSLVTCL